MKDYFGKISPGDVLNFKIHLTTTEENDRYWYLRVLIVE